MPMSSKKVPGSSIASRPWSTWYPAMMTRIALSAFSPIKVVPSSEDEDVFAVVNAFVDLRLVRDEGPQAAVAGGVVGHRFIAVHRVAAVEVPRVVHAVGVIARFRPDELEVAGHRRGRGLARGDRVDRVGPVPLGEDEHLLAEGGLDVLPGAGVADPVGAAAGEGFLHQPLARAA